MQIHLLNSTERVALPGGGLLTTYKSWMSAAEAQSTFEYFMQATPWEQPDIFVAGRQLPTPRLQAWYGDPNAHFTYSGTRFAPLPFTPFLAALAERVSTFVGHKFNSVLINQYRHAQDSVGWHADDEPEFGDKPIIASLSLGSTRRFFLKPKPRHIASARWKKGQRSIVMNLEGGDLLVMNEDVQCLWQHCVPKETRPCTPRINLTFRKVNDCNR